MILVLELNHFKEVKIIPESTPPNLATCSNLKCVNKFNILPLNFRDGSVRIDLGRTVPMTALDVELTPAFANQLNFTYKLSLQISTNGTESANLFSTKSYMQRIRFKNE